ncbi:restriction endonuclease subunit S [Methylomonas sp. CM2]|uniref:restriction endonuclease subunit S n=1 Tax=Methylomonas sp. CM2 TaxID=3417647 RepID=UPI003CF1AE26
MTREVAGTSPENGATVKFEEILKNRKQLSYGVLKPGDYQENGIPMIRVMDIGEWGRFNKTEIFKISKELSKEYKRTIVDRGDIVLSVMATIGRAAIVSDELSGANVNRALAVIKLADNVISEYVLLQLLSPSFQEAFVSRQIGSAQKRINLADLRQFEICIPPIRVQKEIVRRVESLFAQADAVEKQYLAAKQRLDRLSQSLLAKAFRGELVPQDPTDEPAAELLKRIQAERQQQTVDKPKHKKIKNTDS